MGNSLSILPDQGRVRTFACPACRQTIALGCERCWFCSVVIDPASAAAAADVMDRVNLACSEAQDIRALFLREPSAFDLMASSSGRGEFYMLPVLLIRWWLRFGSLRLEDEDLISDGRDMKKYAW